MIEKLEKNEVVTAKTIIPENKEVSANRVNTKSKMLGWKMDVKDCKNNGCLINFN